MDINRPAYAWRPVGLVVLVQAVVLLGMAPFYGPHRDELYFVSAGQRLAWGYPDQPAFTPLLARVATEVAPHNLVVLRLWSVLAIGGVVLLAVQFSRLLGAGRAAQVLTAVVVAASALVMTLGHRLSTATFDLLAWTAILVLVTQALADHRPRLWLVAGVVAGVGLNNKHAVVILLGAVLVAVALDPRTRPALRTRWPWLAGLVALLLWVPNLVWQARHDWPVFALSADIADEYGGVGGRIGLVGEAALMFSPVIFVVWVVGLVQLLRWPDWRAARLPALVFLLVTGLFLVTGGKGYYLAGVIVPLVAAGGTWLSGWRRERVVVPALVLALSAAVAWPALVPVLPPRTFAASFYPAINDDQPETIGWPEYAETVRGVVGALSAEQRSRAVVFTANYGEAGAFEWYGVGAPVYSGHNGWRFWGPPPADAGPVVVVGDDGIVTGFAGCARQATLRNSVGMDNEEQGAGVWVCAGPAGSWGERWGELGHYDA